MIWKKISSVKIYFHKMFFNFKIKQSTEKKEKLFLSSICINSFKILYIYIYIYIYIYKIYIYK